MDPEETVRLAVRDLVRVLEEAVRNPGAREAGAGVGSYAERVERAIERYVQRADVYVAALTRKSEREAALYLESGVPATEITRLGELKSDHTDDTLRAYRLRLAQLAHRGLYGGPLGLKRLRADGSWEALRLPGE